MPILMMDETVTVLQDLMLREAKATDSLHKAAEVMLYDEVTKDFEWKKFFDKFIKNT